MFNLNILFNLKFYFCFVIFYFFILNACIAVDNEKVNSLDNSQYLYLNNGKIRSYILNPKNNFKLENVSKSSVGVDVGTNTSAENNRELIGRKPVEQLIKFLKSLVPQPKLSARNSRINQCWSQPCLNGATCYGSSVSYICVCNIGYSGPNCGLKTYGDQNCLRNEYCNDNGFCQIKTLSFPPTILKMCSCFPGFTGPHCEVKILSNLNKELHEQGNTSILPILRSPKPRIIQPETSTLNTEEISTTKILEIEEEKQEPIIIETLETEESYRYTTGTPMMP